MQPLKAVLCFFPTQTYFFSYHLQTDDKPLCDKSTGPNQEWVECADQPNIEVTF